MFIGSYCKFLRFKTQDGIDSLQTAGDTTTILNQLIIVIWKYQ